MLCWPVFSDIISYRLWIIFGSLAYTFGVFHRVDCMMWKLMLESFWKMHCRKVERTTQFMKIRFQRWSNFFINHFRQFLGEAKLFALLWQLTGSLVLTAIGTLILVNTRAFMCLIIDKELYWMPMPLYCIIGPIRFNNAACL